MKKMDGSRSNTLKLFETVNLLAEKNINHQEDCGKLMFVKPPVHNNDYYDKFEILQYDSGISSYSEHSTSNFSENHENQENRENYDNHEKDDAMNEFGQISGFGSRNSDLNETLVVQQKAKNLELSEESGFKIYDYPVSVIRSCSQISNLSQSDSQTIVGSSLHLDSFAKSSPEKRKLNFKNTDKFIEPIPPLPHPNTFKLNRLTDVEKLMLPGNRDFEKREFGTYKTPILKSWDGVYPRRRFVGLSERINQQKFEKSWKSRVKSTKSIKTTRNANTDSELDFVRLSKENLIKSIGFLLFGIPSSLFPNCKLQNHDNFTESYSKFISDFDKTENSEKSGNNFQTSNQTSNQTVYFTTGLDSKTLHNLLSQFTKISSAYITLENLYNIQIGNNSIENLNMEIVNSAVTHSEFASVFSVHENSAFLNSLKTDVIDVYQQKVVEVLEKKPNLLSLQAKIVKIGRPLIKLATIVKNNYMGNMDGRILGSRICNPISVMHELSDRVIVHDQQTQVLLNKFLKASLATSIKEISRILFDQGQKNNKYHEATAKMYDYDKKPKNSHLPFNSEIIDQAYTSQAYDNYVLTRSHLLKNVCDEQIREYIFLKSLLPLEHWFVQSVQGFSLSDSNLRSEFENLEVLCKENLVLFKKVRLMKLDEFAELSDRAQKEKFRCLEEKKRADLEFREAEVGVKRKRMEEIEEGIREKEEWNMKQVEEGDGVDGENYRLCEYLIRWSKNT